MISSQFTHAETLHRLVKQAIDSGAARSVAEAQAMFSGYRLALAIDAESAASPQHQMVLLTAVTLARRVFLGGVSVAGAVDTPLRIPMPLGEALADAIIALGGGVSPSTPDVPMVAIGGVPTERARDFHVRTVCAGWRGGVVPAHSEVELSDSAAIPPACTLAAALAVSEAFSFVSSPAGAAGRRARGLSLWSPDPAVDWLTPGENEPALTYLPSQLWLIGLGHLGQAYLWGLGLLGYADPSRVHLVLQDIDIVTPSTESTSVLSDASILGQKKTRAMASWAERRGFSTCILERLFDDTFERQPGEPAVALCGLDNALGRRALDSVGFDLVIEAGLGRGHRDFRTIRLHTLPCSRAAVDIWPHAGDPAEDISERAAYTKMLEDGVLDRCGMTLLAGKAVGAPFVGCAAAALAVAELLRFLHGGPLHQLIDLDLQSVEHRTVVRHPSDFRHLNPGFVSVA